MSIDSNQVSMLTLREAASMLKVHPNTLRRWNDQGIIKAYRIGSRGDRRFKRDDIRGFMLELRRNNDERGCKH